MLVLASASPRRKEALAALGIQVRIVPADVDETRRAGESPEDFATRMAREKAAAALVRLAGADDRPWVLAADTVVALGGDVFGKPADRTDARRMLAALSGRTHRVVTAWTLAREGASGASGTTVTEVTFRPLSPEEIDRYVASGEGDDKAGAYAIQGGALWFVESVHGSLPSVVCLPVAEVLRALHAVGAGGTAR